MPKLKTNKAAKKRYSLTATGKVKRTKSNRRHLLANKTKRQKKSGSIQNGYADKTCENTIKKLLKQAKGYYGAKSYRFRNANQAVMKSLSYAYVGRKDKKSNFRKLWIARINAAARMNGTTYSKMIAGLKKANVSINRKMLAEIAVSDPKAFTEIAEVAKKA
mgnify:CR=1 FL=1